MIYCVTYDSTVVESVWLFSVQLTVTEQSYSLAVVPVTTDGQVLGVIVNTDAPESADPLTKELPWSIGAVVATGKGLLLSLALRNASRYC